MASERSFVEADLRKCGNDPTQKEKEKKTLNFTGYKFPLDIFTTLLTLDWRQNGPINNPPLGNGSAVENRYAMYLLGLVPSFQIYLSVVLINRWQHTKNLASQTMNSCEC